MPASKVCDLIEANLPDIPCWLEPGIIPKRGTVILGGETKIGKSFVSLELCRALTTQSSPFDCPFFVVPEQAKVLYVEQEIGIYGLKKRFEKVFAKEYKRNYGEYLWFISQEPGLLLNTSEGKNKLYNLVDEIQPNIVLLDPISQLSGYDENSNNEVADLFHFFTKLKSLYNHNDLSIVFTHHFRKPSNDPRSTEDPLDPYNFRGSSNWPGMPDCVWTWMRAGPEQRNALGHKMWHMKTRVRLRHDECPEDMNFIFNHDGDLRIKVHNTAPKTRALKMPVFTNSKAPESSEIAPPHQGTMFGQHSEDRPHDAQSLLVSGIPPP